MEIRQNTGETCPVTVEQFLSQQQLRYRLQQRDEPGDRQPGIANEAEQDVVQVRATALEDEIGVVIALFPAEFLLDIVMLEQSLKRMLKPLSEQRFREIFPDCEAGSCPSTGGAYRIITAVDVTLYTHRELMLQSGHHNTVLRMLTVDFQRIDQTVELGRFSHALDDLVPLPQDSEPAVPDMTHLFPERAARAAEQCETLPPLPTTATQLLQLAGDPNADAAKLARVIQQDGPTTAKLLSYANSSLYGRTVTINDVKGAIARILGFDIAMGIAIGMTLGKTLQIPEDGTLGLTAYQRDAVYSAALAEKLTPHLPGRLGVSAGKAYLAGLLHNIGFLFLGHSFPEQYQRLAKTREVNPHLPVKTLEYAVLDTGHETLGGRLLSGWGLPGEVVATARHHHDEDYQGDHAAYVHLVGLTVYLLNDHGLAELGQGADLPQASLRYLGLSLEQVSEATEALLEHRDALDQLVRMVA